MISVMRYWKKWASTRNVNFKIKEENEKMDANLDGIVWFGNCFGTI